MFKTITAGILIFCLIAAGIYFYTPALAQKQILLDLEGAGFHHVEFVRSVRHDGDFILKNIQLDEDGFSRMDGIVLGYNRFGFLLNKNFQNITLQAPSFTSDIDENGVFSIAGHDANNTTFPSSKKFTIKDGSLDLLWVDFGAFNFLYDLQVDGSNIFGHLNGNQKPLLFDGNINGKRGEQGFWTADINLQDGKIDSDLIEASRINGDAEITGEYAAISSLLIQLSSGNVKIAGLPWQNVNVSIEGLPNNFKIDFSGENKNPSLVEFSATYTRGINHQKLDIILYAENFSDVLNYLERNNFIENKEALALKNNIQILRQGTDHIYNIRKDEKLIGYLEFKAIEN